MANLRSLKKDIDYLLTLVLDDCMYVIENQTEENKEKVMAIARDVIVKHRELRKRINHIDGKDNPKLVKSYLKDIVVDLYANANSALDQLSVFIEK